MSVPIGLVIIACAAFFVLGWGLSAAVSVFVIHHLRVRRPQVRLVGDVRAGYRLEAAE